MFLAGVDKDKQFWRFLWVTWLVAELLAPPRFSLCTRWTLRERAWLLTSARGSWHERQNEADSPQQSRR